MYTLKDLQDKNLKELKEIGWQLNVFPEGDRRCRQNWIDALAGKNPPLLQLLETFPAETVNSSPTINERAIEVQAQEPIETPPGVESKFGRIVYPKPAAKPIAPATETPPGVESFTEADRPPGRGDGKRKSKTSTAHQLLELFKASAHIIPNSPPGEIESKVSQSAIAPEAKNHLDREEGITLSSTFFARYSPPQPEIIHFQSEADGQLSLLDFTVESADEPPDPDDFPTIDAFNTAMARWDAENAEALAGSLDSMCEWAPCPHEWYEPEADKLPLKASSMSEVMEASPNSSDHSPDSSDHYEVRKCWNFSIPTFDAWCDRANRQNDRDEPPDTGIGARLPGPKPPKFPPRAIGQTPAKHIPNAYPAKVNNTSITPQSHNRHIVAAGSTNQPGRDPPGGDAIM